MTDYEKLKAIIEEIPVLIFESATSSDVSFRTWKSKAERFLVYRYGSNSFEHNQFVHTRFSPNAYTLGDSRDKFIRTCKEGLLTTQGVFSSYLNEMEEHESESPKAKLNYSKVFVVHGHDGEMKQSVARIIEKQGIEAIILSEQANRGKTIIEKLEGNSDVGGAVCLFTADDFGRENSEHDDKLRARQNVVLEAGYFMGKLGRDHVVFLADDGIEMPSDLFGIVYTSTSNWEVELLKELKAMGYSIDFNKLF